MPGNEQHHERRSEHRANDGNAPRLWAIYVHNNISGQRYVHQGTRDFVDTSKECTAPLELGSASSAGPQVGGKIDVCRSACRDVIERGVVFPAIRH
ncbi:MAG: hypothetical protein ABSE64_11915 [Vulcanimicrobiaceae bacterium]